MHTLNLIRYSSAKSKSALLNEIANGISKDHGTGDVFDGVCCAIEAGQEVGVEQFVSPLYTGGTYSTPSGYQLQGRKHQLSLSGAIDTATGLAGYIKAQGCGARTMWRITVDATDIVSTCGRAMGGMVAVYEADGVVLSRSAKPLAISKIHL